MKFLAKIVLVVCGLALAATQSQPPQYQAEHIPSEKCDSSEVEHRIKSLEALYESKQKLYARRNAKERNGRKAQNQ